MADSTATALSDKIIKKSRKLPYTFLHARRTFSRVFLRRFYSIFTETRVEGLENIPEEGPLLVLPNHLSNLDGPLVLGLYPYQLEMLGPRDFKMEPFKSMMMAVYGMTLIRRGYADSEAVSGIIHHLRSRKHLLMFPSGGMWEKRSFHNKSGAVYFSQLTQTPILPVGISGAYMQSHGTLTMHKPSMVLRFGKVVQPVSKKGTKAEREKLLNDANEELQTVMFDLLEPEEKERYNRWARETYSMEVEYRSGDHIETVKPYAEGFLPTLAEFAIKPNLFRPMWKHARKNMDPFMKKKFYSPARMDTCARDLHDNLAGSFVQYLPYRLGHEAHEAALREIVELRELCADAVSRGVHMRIVPTAVDPLTGNVRTEPLVGTVPVPVAP
ncbi:MAG: lysophospholipid acyltransferase family protein [Spirochaetota bacterium]|nr:lysophospholipid acyltransferase family protein [Spirochaetota bacterium]